MRASVQAESKNLGSLNRDGLSTNALRRKGRGNQELVSALWMVCEAVSEAGAADHEQNSNPGIH